jgi:UDP-N-acetylmuramate dehydrogenase
VGLSGKHALALVNRGGARTEDLVALAREIAAGVREAFGVDIVPEPVFVGHRWERPRPGTGSPGPWTQPPDGA